MMGDLKGFSRIQITLRSLVRKLYESTSVREMGGRRLELLISYLYITVTLQAASAGAKKAAARRNTYTIEQKQGT